MGRFESIIDQIQIEIDLIILSIIKIYQIYIVSIYLSICFLSIF